MIHNKRHPKDMGKVEIEAFLNDLVLKRGVFLLSLIQVFVLFK